MNHTFVSYGWYPHGARHFHAGQRHGWKRDDDPAKAPTRAVESPDERFDGIHFGFFDAPEKEFLLVSAHGPERRAKRPAIVLPQPVLFIPGRHGGRGPGPKSPGLSDDHAAGILVDMIVANPAFRDALGRLLRGL